jgi:Protein of unknown function (DUF3311)
MSESTASSPVADSSHQAGAKNGGSSGLSASSGNWKWCLLLLLPYVGLLWLPFYAKALPELWGIPFFYWYQFVWVFITMILTEFVYQRTR